jgi:hypothetical protein
VSPDTESSGITLRASPSRSLVTITIVIQFPW